MENCFDPHRSPGHATTYISRETLYHSTSLEEQNHTKTTSFEEINHTTATSLEEIYQSDTHLKTHSINKCNQCDFVYSQTGDLRKHLKRRSGEKPNKCNQSDYGSSPAEHLRTHLKKTQWRKVILLFVCLFTFMTCYILLYKHFLRTHLKTQGWRNI